MSGISNPPRFVETSEATATLYAPDGAPITVIGTPAIRQSFDSKCLEQAVASRQSPGISHLVLNPDAHAGYGAPVGCVMVSPTHVYPGPVGVDIKCSMSLLQLDLPETEIRSREVRRAIIDAIGERIPSGPGKGQRSVKKARHIPPDLHEEIVCAGPTPRVCSALDIPTSWIERCEDAFHLGPDGTSASLRERLAYLRKIGVLDRFTEKIEQLGSYGGGNHFGEANTVTLSAFEPEAEIARHFGLQDGRIAFLSHCGSRGFGYQLATNQFKTLQSFFSRQGLSFPGGDRELVYAPLGSPEATAYLQDMALGANFATVNHLLINALVLEAFQEIIPGVKGELIYFISHNIAREEEVDGRIAWVHRKGATRAFPGGHPALAGTRYENTGHPILLPGNPQSGSAVMVARQGAEKSCFSVNHGAGRALGRRAAMRTLCQTTVDRDFESADILTNCRRYPLDEAPAAYKDFQEVLRSVQQAGLASTVAKLSARFVIKDGDTALKGAA